jgi:hypothetical protein
MQKVINLESDVTLTAYYKEVTPQINLFPLFLLAAIFVILRGKT